MIILFAAVEIPNNSAAQEVQRPNLAESIAFIKNAVTDHGCTSFQVTSPQRVTLVTGLCTRIQSVNGSTLTLAYSIGQDSKGYDPPPVTSIDLGKLDPTSVKLDIFPVPYPPATRDLDGYRILMSRSDGSKGGEIYVDGKDEATHLIAALVNAIRLCGGTKSVF
jgi:hypothetical protein